MGSLVKGSPFFLARDMKSTEHEGNVLRRSLLRKHVAFHCIPEVRWDTRLFFTVCFFAEFFQADYPSIPFHYHVIRVDYRSFHETTRSVNLAIEVLGIRLLPNQSCNICIGEALDWVMSESYVIGVQLQFAERYLLDFRLDFLVRRDGHLEVAILHFGLFHRHFFSTEICEGACL